MVVLQAACSVVLLGILFRGFDWNSVLELLARLPPWFYPGSLLLLTLGQALYALKWYAALRGVGVAAPARTAIAYYFIGIFFNNFLPSSIGGDATRVLYLGRRHGYARVGASVVLDRFVGFLWLACGGASLLWLSGVAEPGIVAARRVLVALSLGLAGLFLLLLLPVRRSLAQLRWVERLGPLARVFDDRELPPRRAVAVAIAALFVVTTYFLGLGLLYASYFRLAAGLDPPLVAIVGVLLSIGILTNVPVSLNGVGLREQLHYLLFLGLGVPREVAVSASLLVFSQLMLISLLGLALWLRSPDRR